MAAHTELFELVASLTPQEKRYFRLTSELHGAKGDKNYLQLFEAIEEQVKAGKGYFEAEIKRQFKAAKWIKYLPQIKNQLKSILQETLIQFHRNTSREVEVFQYLHLQEILYNRRLYQQSQKVLAKAAQIARDFELVRLLPEINFREQMLMLELESRNLPERWEEQHQVHQLDMQRLEVFWQYYSLHHHVMTAYREKATKKAMDLEDLIPTEIPAGTGYFWAGHYAKSALAVLKLIEGKVEESHQSYQALVAHWRNRPWAKEGKMKPNESRFQMKLLANYLNIAFQADQFSEFETVRDELLKMGEMNDFSLDEEAELFQNVRFLELRFYMNTADVTQGNRLIPIIHADLERFLEKVNRARERAFFFNLGVFLFLQGRFSAIKKSENEFTGPLFSAVFWFDQLLAPPKTDVRKDLEIGAHILMGIAFLEQDGGDAERGISALESLKRQLQSDRKLDSEFQREEVEWDKEVIRRLLRIFKKMGEASSDLEQELISFIEWCQKIKMDHGTRGIQWLQPVYFWALALRKGCPILAIYQSEAQGNTGSLG